MAVHNSKRYNHTVVSVLDNGARAKLEELYEGSALTWEGMCDSTENLEAICKAFVEIGANPNEKLEFCSVRGSAMNQAYGLTGDNAYQDDLTILSCPLDGFDNWKALVYWRMRSGGRWFDDIVDNNTCREQAKRVAA